MTTKAKLLVLDGVLVLVTIVALFLGINLALKLTADNTMVVSVLATIVAFAVSLAAKDIRPSALCPLWGWGGFTFLVGSVFGMLLR